MSLTINVATVYPKEILSSGNTVARHGIRHIYTTASFLLQPNLYHPLCNKNEFKGTVFEEEQNAAWILS